MIAEEIWMPAGFEPLSELGRGTCGVVWRVRERATSREFALKALQVADPDAILRLKREFRIAKQLAHANLIALHELFVDGNRGCFTMEIVVGVHLTSAVENCAALLPGVGGGTTTGCGFVSPAWLKRLKSIFAQLCSGLAVLHENGIVHQDLKPENVLVTSSSRVVILDFGLAALNTELPSGGVEGTFGWIAPERFQGAPPAPSADLYAVGALLYHCLTGSEPFPGEAAHAYQHQLELDIARPIEANPHLDPNLSDLAMHLLNPEPGQRPSPAKILAVLDGSERGYLPEFNELLDREHELRTLFEFVENRTGGTGAVAVTGPSGSGKSRLLQSFVRTLRGRTDVLVLSGRCTTVERFPFQGLDSLIDDLAWGVSIDRDSCSSLQNPELRRQLARLFPVLVPSERPSSARSLDRLPAIEALVDVLRDLAVRFQLVVVLDDAQWLDPDSLWALGQIARSDHLRTKFVFGSQPDYLGRLAEILDISEDLPLHPLSLTSVFEWLESRDPSIAANVHWAIGMANEVPAFILPSLIAGATEGRSFPLVPPEERWSRFVVAHLTALSEATRRALELLCLAEAPLGTLELKVLLPEVMDPDFPTRELLGLKLIHQVQEREGRKFTSIHNTIRDLVRSRIRGRNELHLELATCLADHQAEPELIGHHLVEAGARARALPYYVQAAEQALHKLAFERAAELCQRALGLGGEQASVGMLLADALAGAGRLTEAAVTLDGTLDYADGATRSMIAAKAADLYIGAGHLNDGRRLLSENLAGWSIRLPRTNFARLLRLAWWTGPARIRRSACRLDDEPSSKLDAVWVAAANLGLFDPIGALALHKQHQVLAYRMGNRSHIARALSIELCFELAQGKNSAALSDRLDVVLAGVSDRRLHAYANACRGYGSFLGCDWANARSELRKALEEYGEATVGMWERRFCETAVLASETMSLDVSTLRAEVGRLRGLAVARGDETSRILLDTTAHHLVLLLGDDAPLKARYCVESALAAWPEDPPSDFEFRRLVAHTQIDLYQDDVESAAARWQPTPRCVRELGRFRFVRLSRAWWEGITLIARAGPDLSRVQVLVDGMDSEGPASCSGLARMLEGLFALRAQDHVHAERTLKAARQYWRADGKQLLVAAVDSILARSLRPLASLGVLNPEAALRLVTGFSLGGRRGRPG